MNNYTLLSENIQSDPKVKSFPRPDQMNLFSLVLIWMDCARVFVCHCILKSASVQGIEDISDGLYDFRRLFEAQDSV